MSKAIIIVSFGTANLEGLQELEEFEAEIKESVNGKYHVCKAFTSSVLSNILFNKYGKVVPRLEEVLFNLSNDRYKEVYIQPLHVIEGSEYSNIEKIIKEYHYSFSKITLGNVLMSNKDEQLKESCNLIVNAIEENLLKTDNIVLVGHGSKTINTNAYNTLKDVFIENGYKNVYIGTLEGEIKKEDVIKKLLNDNTKNVILAPILMLPGNHIKKDIFGEINSWKASIKENNINVTSSKKALLEYEEIREYYINKIKKEIK
ncbi:MULTISPECIES: sirohydrochlorin cobaltochelatase [unclassified Clostridium]|uniref:sirohydrochlorin cobaltochelatase n=1 Tax=unclassified Clostridium TaxID=2614128 RepID=UPI00189B81AD|nr:MULTISPECIES: sirohydrochlorin cobaltochelatase [unclassified Clostridium]